MKSYFDLRDYLAAAYPTPAEWRRVAGDAGADVGNIVFEGSSLTVWSNILKALREQNRLVGLIDVLNREDPDSAQLAQAFAAEAAPVPLPHASRQSLPNTDTCAISFAAGSSFRSAANLVARTYRIPPPTLIGFTDEELSTRIRTGQINMASATDAFLGLRNLLTSGAVRPYDVRSDPGSYVLIVKEQP